MIVFMSDNGSFFGEHGLSVERRLPYEESVKCPLLVSHAAAIEPGRRVTQLALSIDIAPTLIEAAGGAIPTRVQGRSLIPLLHGNAPRWRESCLIEYYSQETPFPWLTNLDYRAVRLGRYKYIRWIRYDDASELYDLESDPFEQRNLAYDPKYAATVSQARAAMSSLVVESLGLRP
jgi:arylsulfatase A-like enzyme